MTEDNKKKVVFLDRDGTINVDSGYVYRVEDWMFAWHAPEALKLLQDAGFTLGVVTNQSGIGQGLYTEEDMNNIHEHMFMELKKKGVSIQYLAFCPHSRDSACDCRKPGIGMIKELERQIGQIDYAGSWTIGDKLLDFELGRNASTNTALIRSEYWNSSDLEEEKPDIIVDSLYEAAQAIIDK